jgi:hypothetical protein
MLQGSVQLFKLLTSLETFHMLQGSVQLFKISPTPDAAYEICTSYAPDCHTAIGGAEAVDDNRDEEEEDEEEEEEEDEEEEEEAEEDVYQINGTSDPLVVTHGYQHNITYVSP